MLTFALALFVIAQAPPDAGLDEAKARFAEGKAAYELGHFSDALTAFEAAYTAKPLPGFLFNLGQCHFGLGHYDRAVFFYERYLELLPEAQNRALVEQLIVEAKQKAADARAATAAAAAEAAANARKTPAPTPTPTPAPAPAPPPPEEDGTPWGIVLGATAGAVAVVAGGAVVVALLTQPHPPASTLGTLDRSGP